MGSPKYGHTQLLEFVGDGEKPKDIKEGKEKEQSPKKNQSPKIRKEPNTLRNHKDTKEVEEIDVVDLEKEGEQKDVEREYGKIRVKSPQTKSRNSDERKRRINEYNVKVLQESRLARLQRRRSGTINEPESPEESTDPNESPKKKKRVSFEF